MAAAGADRLCLPCPRRLQEQQQQQQQQERPLAGEQLQRAAGRVRHLLPLAHRLLAAMPPVGELMQRLCSLWASAEGGLEGVEGAEAGAGSGAPGQWLLGLLQGALASCQAAAQ